MNASRSAAASRPPAPLAPRGILATETRLFAREAGSLFWIVAFPAALLLILGFVPSFRDPDEALDGLRIVDVYVSVVVLLAALMAAILSMPATLTSYRERGILKRLKATPVRPGALLRAQVIVHAGAIALGTVTALAVGRIVHDVELPANVLAWALAYAVAVLAALAIGALVTAVSSTTKIATTVGTIVLFPMMFTAGVWIPVPTMQGWLQDIVLATPLGAASRALADASAGEWPRWVDLAVTFGWSAVLAALAVRLFRWE